MQSITLVAGIVAICAAVFGGISVAVRQLMKLAIWVNSVDRNTQATIHLSDTVEKLAGRVDKLEQTIDRQSPADDRQSVGHS